MRDATSDPRPASGRWVLRAAPHSRPFATVPPTSRRRRHQSEHPRAYSGALRRLDAWLDGGPLEDATLAAYLAELHDQGRGNGERRGRQWPRRASGPASPASPVRPGERTARVRRRPLATCHQPRTRAQAASTRSAGLLFMAGMRQSEVSALRWADVDDAADGGDGGYWVTVHRGKKNQEVETRDDGS